MTPRWAMQARLHKQLNRVSHLAQNRNHKPHPVKQTMASQQHDVVQSLLSSRFRKSTKKIIGIISIIIIIILHKTKRQISWNTPQEHDGSSRQDVVGSNGCFTSCLGHGGKFKQETVGRLSNWTKQERKKKQQGDAGTYTKIEGRMREPKHFRIKAAPFHGEIESS